MIKKLDLLSRRRFLTQLGGLALAQSLPGCDRWDNKPLTIAAHVWPGYEPIFLAREKKWLDSTKVHLIDTTSATDSLQALIDGKVDGAALTLDEMLKARAENLPLSMVMIFNISAGADMLVARPGIKELADLKGKRVGFEQGAVGELVLAEILRITGLSKDDFKWVLRTIDKHRETWINHEVDAIITYEPVASQLLADEGINLFDSRQIPNMIVDVLAIRTDLLTRHYANAIQHLIFNHFRALDHLNHNPLDAAYRISKRLDLPAEKVLSAFKGLVLPDAANNYRLLAGTSPEFLSNARKLSNIMVNSHLLKQNDSLTALIRADYLPTEFAKMRYEKT